MSSRAFANSHTPAGLRIGVPKGHADVASRDPILFDAGLRTIYSASRALLKQYPVGVMAAHGSFITITPIAAGFSIIVSMDVRGGLLLHFGGWHEEAMSPSDIISLLDKALAGKIRLVDEFVGGKPLSHSVEVALPLGDWSLIGEISYVRFFQSWRVRTRTVRSFPRGDTNAEICAAQPPDFVA